MELLKINVESEAKKVINYLLNKQAHNLGFIRYSLFKKMIVYITKIKSLYQIRKIFLHLVDKKIFIKKKLIRKVIYINFIIQMKQKLKKNQSLSLSINFNWFNNF